MAGAEADKRAAEVTRKQLRDARDALGLREREQHAERSRPASPSKRPRTAAVAAQNPTAAARAEPRTAANDQALKEEVQELRAMLEEAQRQLWEVGAQLAEAVGQRDTVTAQAEAAARDATKLLQLMARRAETQPPSQEQEVAAGAAAGIKTESAESQPSQLHQATEATVTSPVHSTSPSAADVERLEQQLQVLFAESWPAGILITQRGPLVGVYIYIRVDACAWEPNNSYNTYVYGLRGRP